MRPIKTFALVALSAAVPALGADVAVAAKVEVKALYYKPVHQADAVVLVAAPGEANAVTMVQDGSVVVVSDRVPLVAGPGCGRSYDQFSGGAKADGADTLIGGTAGPGELLGSDWLNYERRRQGVHADRDGDRDDGAPGERDLIGADIEVISGSQGPDVLTGGPGTDHLDGNDGRDLIRGGAGTDYLVGDPWVIDRSRSEDRIHGGAGDDVLTGGAGGDRLTGGPGDDTIYAGPGPDRVHTRDGAADTVICGRGRDTLLFDALDFPRPDCERLTLG